MKTVLRILGLGLLTALLTIAAMAKDVSHVPVKQIATKDKGLFVFKADKNLLGAKVEILQSNGSLIAEQLLTRRKLVIDFNDIRAGLYTIRITKGMKTQELHYLKQ
jgi:hypothetical protein